MAYLWGWLLVNVANRSVAFSKAPEPGLLGGVVPVAFNRIAMLTGYISPEEHFIACPNQDVTYSAGFMALDKEPIVFQVPNFGDRFWVYALYDARTDEFSESDSANLDAVVAHTCGDEAVRGAVSVFIDRVGTLIEQGGPMVLLFEPPKDLWAATDNRTSPHRSSTNQKT